ncbi:ferredoxin [Natronocella acetinitrilica]|uniref:Ferredoxin n=1 Tax=Natronocella acetinitrilica TaxID=414046 RepID=A0AAE3KDC2_9GAMM|nr:4Fe-4S dicluster domain-containing protein [Natronocella acetinitrilica]MCP1676699.1 ferredoxin [Natronocella acetinitrilica]
MTRRDNNANPGLEEYQPIDASEPRLRLDAASCLPARDTRSGCSACVTACPASVLTVTGAGPSLTGDCLGCGQCVPVCPTDALQVEGFPALPAPGQPAPSITRVECWRVPDGETRPGTLRVPCLGGLDTGQLLTLQRLAGGEHLALVDRGWCSDCPAHGDRPGHPAQAAIAHAHRLLDEGNADTPHRPRLSREPLPQRMACRTIPGRDMEARVGRRHFFRRLGGHAAVSHAAATTTSDAPPEPRALVDKRVPRARRRLSGELMLAVGSLPSSILPRLTVNADCEGHGICTAVCPTGALVREEENTASRLVLDATACIACGLCQSHCPEQAIRLASQGGGQALTELQHMEQRECLDCGRPFTARNSNEEICHPCRKSRRFAAAGFAFLTQGNPAVSDQNHGGQSG